MKFHLFINFAVKCNKFIIIFQTVLQYLCKEIMKAYNTGIYTVIYYMQDVPTFFCIEVTFCQNMLMGMKLFYKICLKLVHDSRIHDLLR